MKLKLKTALLKLWLGRVTKNIKGGRSGIPVLDTVRLEADEEGYLTLDFTNLDIWQKVTFPVEVISGGSALVNADRLSRAIALMEDEEVTIEVAAKGLVVQGKFGNYTFATLPAAEFPSEPPSVPEDGSMMFYCTGSFLASAIETVDFSLCKDDGRYALQALKVEVAPKSLRLVTTDGRRLSMFDRALPAVAEKGEALIPASTVKAIKALAADADAAQVTVYADKAAVDVWCGAWWLHSKLQDSQFPNYRQVLPSTEGRPEIPIVVEEWEHAVSAVLAIGSEENKLTIAGNRISLEAPEVGSAWMQVSDTAAEEVCVNPKFLLEALKAAPTLKASFLPGKNGEPVVMTMPNQKESDAIRWTHVLMPIRTSGGGK